VTQPVLATENAKGHREYVHPLTGERVPSVTTIISVGEKGGLDKWKQGIAVDTALQRLNEGASLSEARAAGMAEPARIAQERAAIGSRVHEAIEHFLLTGERLDTKGIEGYLRAFSMFYKNYKLRIERVNGLRLVERTVWSEQYRYAGTFDFMARIDGKLYVGDWKTGKDLYPSVALQLAALAHADYILAPDGTKLDMPQIDGGIGVVIREDPDTREPILSGAIVDISDRVFRAFLGLRQYFAFLHEDDDPWRQGQLTALRKQVSSSADKCVNEQYRHPLRGPVGDTFTIKVDGPDCSPA